MLWLPNKGKTRVITNLGIVGAAPPVGVGIPSNATTLLDGAVTEVISAANNDQDSWGIMINLSGTSASATASEACCDILIGGATDDLLIPALLCGYAYAPAAAAISLGYTYLFPLHIPQGKRIAASLASVRTGITGRISIWLFGGGVPPWQVGRKVTTVGTQANNARGQAITPAVSGGAATSTQMTASTAEDYFAFLPGYQPATDTTITPAGTMNIGIGVGADPPDRIGTWWFHRDTLENGGGPFPCWPAFQDVPAGSRLAILASNSTTNDAANDALIYAVS